MAGGGFRNVDPKDMNPVQREAAQRVNQRAVQQNQNQQDAVEQQMKALQEFKVRSSETTDSGASFAAKIQGGVSNDTVQKNQLKVLEQIKDLLARRGQQLQQNGARFN